jgi:ribulose 1,5-bisphosphate synthetase/thiazole synthase
MLFRARSLVRNKIAHYSERKDMKQDYDVLIVGGGFAGNCLALASQASHLKIAIVEASSLMRRIVILRNESEPLSWCKKTR